MRSVVEAFTTPQPVSLVEVKAQLGYSENDSSSDDRLTRLIVAATEIWERDTQSITTERVIHEKLPEFPEDGFRLYYRPVPAITSIKYFDPSGTEVTLPPTVYSYDAPNRMLYLANGQSFPGVQSRWDAVTIEYTAGLPVIPEIAKQAILVQCDVMEELRGTTKEKDATIRLYENLVLRFQRSSYP